MWMWYALKLSNTAFKRFNLILINVKSCSNVTGTEAQMSRVFTSDDVKKYIELTNDDNPVHAQDYVKNSIDPLFPKPIVHGALINSLVSAVMGTKLPGPGTIVARQTLNFPNPLYIGEMVTAKVIVTKQRKSLVKCDFYCFKNDKTVVLHGNALLYLKK